MAAVYIKLVVDLNITTTAIAINPTIAIQLNSESGLIRTSAGIHVCFINVYGNVCTIGLYIKHTKVQDTYKPNEIVLSLKIYARNHNI